MKIIKKKLIVAGLLGAASLAALASPVGVDGSLGGEWDGVAAVSVGYDSAAARDNFGAPGLNSNNVAYNVYYRSDANYLYGLLLADGDTKGLNFGNLYFNTNLSGGSDIVIELDGKLGYTLKTGAPTMQHTLDSYLTVAHSLGGNVNHGLEFALSWDYFSEAPDGVLPVGTDPDAGVQLRMIQAFGYSVAGGDMNPQTNARFGTVAQLAVNDVPEPSGLALGALALVAAGAAGRRRKSAR